jgi:hypothetical protein
VIRNVVWDHLHGYREPTPCKDVDLAFFDPHDLRPERDEEVQRQLAAQLPGVPWEVTNQAAVHLWYERVFGYTVPPVTSTADGVGTWPETVTNIAVRLQPDDSLLVVAPSGLDDLFKMILRRNPRRVSLMEFQRRLRDKAIQQKWPQVRVIEE